MSVSPQRPLEIVLPTLPELQGATVSRECLSQFFPPGNVAELRASPRLQGSPEQLHRWLPAGPPCQGIDLAAPNTPEASLERLAPLVDYLAAWKLLPNVSRWVLQTVEKGYRIQFGAPPPPFKGLCLTSTNPEQALVLEQEVSSLLRKEAIEVVPPLDRESGFYSRYFRCSKEGWRATSNFRSAATEPLSQPPEVQNAYCKTGRVSDQIRGLVRHDRSKRRLFPCIHPSQSQEVPEVRFQGQSLPISGSSLRPSTLTPNFHEVRGCCTGSSATPGHPHTQLHRRLVDFSSFRAVGGSTSRCRSSSHERVGVKTKCKEKSPFQRTTYLGVVWDSTTMQARLSPARIESILNTVRRVREGLSLTVKQFQILLGLMAAASNVIPFGLLYMRPLQWWLKSKGFSPRGNPFRMIKVTRRCLRALDMWRNLGSCLRARSWEHLAAA